MLGRRPLVRGVARTAVVAGTATAVSGRVARRQNNKWAAQDQAPVDQVEQVRGRFPGGGPGELDEDPVDRTHFLDVVSHLVLPGGTLPGVSPCL